MHKGRTPQPGGRFHRIVESKAAQQRQYVPAAENMPDAYRGGSLVTSRTAGRPAPQGERTDQNDAQGAHHGGNKTVSRPP